MTITRYRKRPVEVDTIEWTGSNINELIDFTGGDFRLVNPDDGDFAPDVTAKVYDRLHDTWVGVKTGQHVIHGVQFPSGRIIADTEAGITAFLNADVITDDNPGAVIHWADQEQP